MPGLLIPLILFADDIVLLAVSREDLEKLVNATLKYFSDHKLTVSSKKTNVKFEVVNSFKYLGVKFNSRPYKLFSDFNAQIVNKCESFLHSILSLTRCNFDRSFMALTLWKQVALPTILYGSECIPLTQNTIDKIEKTQNKIGKFALQVSPSSANIQVYESFMDDLI